MRRESYQASGSILFSGTVPFRLEASLSSGGQVISGSAAMIFEPAAPGAGDAVGRNLFIAVQEPTFLKGMDDMVGVSNFRHAQYDGQGVGIDDPQRNSLLLLKTHYWGAGGGGGGQPLNPWPRKGIASAAVLQRGILGQSSREFLDGDD